MVGYAPRLRVRESAFDPLSQALERHAIVQFPYLKPGESASRLRTVAPLAREPRNVLSVGDMSVTELGGRFVDRRLDRENLERSARLALDGVLSPVITAIHPLADAPAALATVENGHAAGKVVIKVA